jgi:hypothetical protein
MPLKGEKKSVIQRAVLEKRQIELIGDSEEAI